MRVQSRLPGSLVACAFFALVGCSSASESPAGALDASADADATSASDGSADAPDLGPMPTWRTSGAKFRWIEIPQTSMTTVKVADPSTGDLVAPTQRIDAWNGLAANRDTDRLYLAGAGGHADWSGNEAYEIDLHRDQPTWKLLRGPTMAPDVLASNGSKGIYHHYYADGRPSSTHLYFALQFVRARGRVFKMSAGSIWGTGNEANNKVDAFALANNDWDPEGTFDEPAGGSAPSPTAPGPIIGRAYAQHPDTEDIYTLFGGAFHKWTAATAKWSTLAPQPAYANSDIVSESASAVDPTSNRVLYARNAYRVEQLQGLVYDITSDTVADATFTGSAAAQVVKGGAGMVFVTSDHAFFLKTGSAATVLRIDPTTFAAEPVPTTGPQPPDAVNGVYTRWLYLPRLKGIAYLPSGSSNVWFLPTE